MNGKTFLIILTVFLLICMIVNRANKEENEAVLLPEAVSFHNANELAVFCAVENRVERSRIGNVQIHQSQLTESKESDYHDICPELLAPTQDEEEIVSTIVTDEKTVFLSFDDGPSALTGKILDILKRYQIKATFFVISCNISESGLENLRRTQQEGHVIGIHADSHDYNKMYQSVQSFLEDYMVVFEMVTKETGVKPHLYRFPGGSYNSAGRKQIKEIVPEMERRGFVCFDWNVSAEDAVGTPTANSIYRNIFRNIETVDQPIILMHDSVINELTVDCLPKIIEELIRRGYRFDTLDHRTPYQFQWD